MRSAMKIFCAAAICVAALAFGGCVGNDYPPSLINTTAPIETTPAPPQETTPAENDTTPAETTPAQTTPADTTAPEFEGWSDFH